MFYFSNQWACPDKSEVNSTGLGQRLSVDLPWLAIYKQLSQHGPVGQERVASSPGDGHCLLNFVCSSWQSQLRHLPPTSVHDVKQRLFIQTVSNPEINTPFIIPSTNSALISGLKAYSLNCQLKH